MVLARCAPIGQEPFWWVNNAGAVAGDDGVVIVDTCATEQRTRRFLEAVAEATRDAPVRMAVNTHQHGDHAYGNSLLPDHTVIFGHEAMRDAQLADPLIDGCPPIWTPVPAWGNVTRRVPAVAFRSELTLHSGRRRIELRHPGHAAHTAGDVVARLPEERVPFTGDLLFNGLTPMVLMGSLEGALKSLDWRAGFQAEHVVPGHGPLAGRSDLPEILARHEQVCRRARWCPPDGMQAGIGGHEASLQQGTGMMRRPGPAPPWGRAPHRARRRIQTGTRLYPASAWTAQEHECVEIHGIIRLIRPSGVTTVVP
ncbi:MBL fold metallo-hydrolase [Nonomuraea africana]|uniref:MBL fold metallo-hydrolase n=1 Tax=Nonomuraea africana TaxID=46171 RepID=UPI0033C0AAC1